MATRTKSTPHTKSKPTSGYMTRIRLIAASIGLVIVASGVTVYALLNFHEKFVSIIDIPTIVTSDSDRVGSHSTTKTGTDSPQTTPAPTAVITPAPSSDVPSLKPAPIQSNNTTIYQSTNWAGYLASGGNYTAITGSWTTPSPVTTSEVTESGDGTWIGIGGITTPDLIQIGTQNTISPSGVVSTSGFYELLPAGAVGIASLVIRPGDVVSASITQTSVGQWAISLTNVTRGRTFSISVSYNSSYSSAEWIQEDPSYPDGSLVLLDNFGTVPFTNATATTNGTTMSAAAGGASPITLIGQGGAAGHSGVPISLNGDSFSVQYR